jgi:hypothetical protein
MWVCSMVSIFEQWCLPHSVTSSYLFSPSTHNGTYSSIIIEYRLRCESLDYLSPIRSTPLAWRSFIPSRQSQHIAAVLVLVSLLFVIFIFLCERGGGGGGLFACPTPHLHINLIMPIHVVPLARRISTATQ